ncbi:MAG: hypothetical protein LBP25_00575 [Tannerellaceae bacterium]|nr:hypothetical protein [Tannerellaceae bacterium]
MQIYRQYACMKPPRVYADGRFLPPNDRRGLRSQKAANETGKRRTERLRRGQLFGRGVTGNDRRGLRSQKGANGTGKRRTERLRRAPQTGVSDTAVNVRVKRF